jgi:hypothetical protein
MQKLSGLVWGLTLATSGLAFGQAVVQETQTTAIPAGANTEIRRVSQLLGSTVRLQGTDNFGKVEDAVLDNNGAINYLVVSNGGRYAMMPWNAANFNYGQRVVTYNVAPQAVQPLFFQPNTWPNLSDQQFTNRINQVFPGTGVVRRDSLRPVGSAPGGPGPEPGPGVVKEKVKEKPNGEVKVKEKVK